MFLILYACFFGVKLSITHCFIILRMMEIECILMIIRHILMLLNYDLFYMIRCQYVISLDVLLTTITLIFSDHRHGSPDY